MHTIHLLDFNTLSTNVIPSRTSVLKETILFSSHECNINMRKQGPVPQHMGELASDIPFLISLKIKLSFIPVHVHACTPLLMAQPKVSPLNKNEDSNPPITSLSSHPCIPLSLQEKGIGGSHVKPFSALCHQNSDLRPTFHPSESIRNHWVPTAARHAPAKGSQPVCGSPSLTPAEREELSSEVHQEKFPLLIVSPEKPY